MLLLLFATQITLGILISTQRVRVSLLNIITPGLEVEGLGAERERQVGTAINKEAEL